MIAQILALAGSLFLLHQCDAVRPSAIPSPAEVAKLVPLDEVALAPIEHDLKTWPSHSKRFAVSMGLVSVAKKHKALVRTKVYDLRHDIEICRNTRNNSVPLLGWFVCPQEADSEDDVYCCGAPSAEYCCSYWESAGGRCFLYALLGSLLLSTLAVAMCVFLFLRHRANRRESQFITCHREPHSNGSSMKHCIVEIEDTNGDITKT